MHTITGWVSRNLHAITMRRVQRAGAFDGYENNTAICGGDVEIILSVSWSVPELFACTNDFVCDFDEFLTIN